MSAETSSDSNFNLVILSTNSVGNLYKLAQTIDQLNIRVLEIMPSASECYLLCTGDLADLKSICTSNTVLELSDNQIVDVFPQSLVNAFLGLSNQSLQKYFYIIESDDVLQLFLAANNFIQNGFSILDFRVFRGSKIKGFVLFTSEKKAEDNLLHMDVQKSRSLKVTEISEPSNFIKSLF